MTPQERETLFYGEQSDPVIVDELVGLLKRIVMVTCDGPWEMPWRVVSSGSPNSTPPIRKTRARQRHAQPGSDSDPAAW